MGSSAFDPVVLADVRSVKNKISMAGVTADVFAVGDVIRYDPATDKYLRAQADTETNANFIGVIESINATDMVVVYSGEISLPDSVMSNVAGYTGAQVFYLSDAQEGKLTTTSPSNPGSVIKPVIITTGTVQDSSPTLGTVDGIVVNSIGSKISGDSTVDLSDIQPVGSILAFAGKTGNIPTGWEICDGGYLSVSTYSDLYAALNSGSIYGFIQNGTLTKVANSGSGSLTNDNLIGSYLLAVPSGALGSIKCTILAGTVSGDTVTGIEVFVDPAYFDGAFVGTYHNLSVSNGTNCKVYLSNGTALSVQYTISSTSKTKFKKPDLRARFIIGDSRGITGVENSAFSSYTVGRMGGEETHSLTLNEMPIHRHDSTYSASLSGNISTSLNNLATASAGAHNHELGTISTAVTTGGSGTVIVPAADASAPLQVSASHTHAISGNLTISSTGLTPAITVNVENSGGNIAHNNVPQHMVMYWIIKHRKDSYAKILKLGPSGGGAVIAKNTAKRWVRVSGGIGCTADIGYGTWGISRASQGNYILSHDLFSELGTADQTKYIVEAAVSKNDSGATQMFIANPYGYGGLTFGVRVWDVIGATHSDNFQYLNLTMYGGGTAV
jgi:microcystin-dependent protein